MNETTQPQTGLAGSNGTETGNENATSEAIGMIAIAGGAALVVFGAGLILSHPGVRRLAIAGLSRAMPDLETPLKAGIAGLIPDVERYMKIRAM